LEETGISANLTRDPETGIGRRSDAEVARILRFGVRADGRAAFPLMELQLSDEDLTSILSYLRAQRATAHAVPEHQLTRSGRRRWIPGNAMPWGAFARFAGGGFYIRWKSYDRMTEQTSIQ
jgi:hypothetical protein